MNASGGMGLLKGRGLWRFPNFFKSVRIDASQWGFATACELHYRRLTIENGARRLPPVPVRLSSEPPLSVYFMSGREHWAMTAFCAYSLLAASNVPICPIVLDDGTLDNSKRDELRRIVPSINFIEAADAAGRAMETLKPKRFPALHRMRNELPLMKKLIDLHAGQIGWRLFLDSDMLFYREPAWMIDWLRSPQRPAHMWDFQDSYGYSHALIEKVLGSPMPAMINTGICGLQSDAIDWNLVETWAAQFHVAADTNHFSEQCLTAMWMSISNAIAAPSDYLIWPSEEESRAPAAVMHHYVAESRTWYHMFGWPSVLRRALTQ